MSAVTTVLLLVLHFRVIRRAAALTASLIAGRTAGQAKGPFAPFQ
ncbi:hypothetical protein [Methylocapsa acidiphila]|nr:hypothetical protein [Methylocapsa acidiphila]